MCASISVIKISEMLHLTFGENSEKVVVSCNASVRNVVHSDPIFFVKNYIFFSNFQKLGEWFHRVGDNIFNKKKIHEAILQDKIFFPFSLAVSWRSHFTLYMV